MKNLYATIPCFGVLGFAALLPNFVPGSASPDRQSNHLLARTTVLGPVALVQETDTPGKSPTASGIKHKKHNGPIVVNWKIKPRALPPKVIDGVKYEPVDKDSDINLTVNPDGSWNFSGSFPAKPDHDIDVVMGLKSSEGSIVLFRYAGNMQNGVNFNKTGVSQTLKDNFKAFQSESWYANYRMPESAEGIAQKYEQRKRRKDREEKAQEHREADKERQEVAAEAARLRAHQPSSSGGGGGVSNVLGDVANTLSSGVSAVGNAVESGISDLGSSLLSIF